VWARPTLKKRRLSPAVRIITARLDPTDLEAIAEDIAAWLRGIAQQSTSLRRAIGTAPCARLQDFSL